MNFYYASAFIEYVNASTPVFSNIKVNATSMESEIITGFFETVYSKTTSLLLENSEVIG